MTASYPDPRPEPSPLPPTDGLAVPPPREPDRPDAATPGTADPLDPWPGEMTWRAVSHRLVWLRASQLAISVVPLAGLALLAGFAVAPWLGVVVAVGGCCLVAFRAVVIVRAVRSWGYAERDDDLLVRHGLLVRRLSIVPYARMQFVDVSAGPLERAFGLATVQLHTAAAASDARIPGLPPGEAARLRDRLAALGQVRAEGL